MTNCCVNCFSSNTLKEYIKNNGHRGNCDFCSSKNVYCIMPSKLQGLFVPVVRIYDIFQNFGPIHDNNEYQGQYLWEKLDKDWQIFKVSDSQIHETLVKEIFSDNNAENSYDMLLSSVVERKGEYWTDDYKASTKLEGIWDDFCKEIKLNNRYFPNTSIDLALLQKLLSHFNTTLKVKTHLFRARRCDIKKWKPSQMGKPPVDRSQPGRANPKGINYLYLASDKITCIAEIKPSIQEEITVATFSVKVDLKLLDLRNLWIYDPFSFGEDLTFVLKYERFLVRLGSELSKTIGPKDAELEYVPLQYLCEFVKKAGYDGIIYKSSVADGSNFAIFNDNKLKCTRTTLTKIEKVEYAFHILEEESLL